MAIPQCSVDGCQTGVKAAGYCSRHYAQMHLTGSITPMIARECLLAECDVMFMPKRRDQRYCCGRHASKGWRLEQGKADPQTRNCSEPTCGKPFHTYRAWQRFCSPTCADTFKRTDPELTERHRTKMRTRYHTDPTVKVRTRLGRYGLTVEQYEAIFESQESACAICHSPDPRGDHWHVDHDHNTGRVRGVLCARCNVGIGHFGEDPERLLAAIHYLRQNA